MADRMLASGILRPTTTTVLVERRGHLGGAVSSRLAWQVQVFGPREARTSDLDWTFGQAQRDLNQERRRG